MKKLIYFYLFVIALTTVVNIWLIQGFADGSGFPLIRSDGDGYYVYLPTLLIHHTLDFSVLKHHFMGNIVNCHGILFNASTGKYMNIYPIGVAVLISPFFLIAHALTAATNLFALDGYSLIYQCSPQVSALFYYMVGSYFLFKSLLNHYSYQISVLTIILITFGTSLFHYITFDAIFSHVYTFCFVSILVYLSEKFWSKPSLKIIFSLGIVIGILFLIRNYNLIYLLYFFLYPINEFTLKPKKNTTQYENFKVVCKNVFLIFIVAFFTAMPQFLIWKNLAGSFIVYSYGGIGFNWLSPKIIEVLFSTDKGLFFWTPTLIFSCFGFLTTLRNNSKIELKKISVISILILSILVYIISSWRIWNFGASYGHRGFVDAYAFFAFGLAAALEYSYLNQSKIPVFTSLIVLTGLVNVQMYNYWTGVIPFEKTTLPVYWKALQHFPQRLYVGLFVPKSKTSLKANSGLAALLNPTPDQKIPNFAQPGQKIPLQYSVINTGKSYWLDISLNPNPGKVFLGVLWFPQEEVGESCKRPPIPPTSIELIPFPKLVAPGEKVYIQGSVQAPKVPGKYTMIVEMLSDRVAWFGDLGNSSATDCYNIVIQNPSP